MNFSGVKDTDLYILSQLDDKTLFNICLTNKHFNNLCKNEMFWKNRMLSKYPEEYNLQKHKGRDVSSLSWKQLYLKKVYEESLFVGNLEKTIWTDAPFHNYGGLNISREYQWYKDKYDNWVIYRKSNLFTTAEMTYISSVQRENGERMIIDLERNIIGILTNTSGPNWTNNLKYEELKKYINSTIDTFLRKKDKLFYLDLDQKAREDFKREITSHIL